MILWLYDSGAEEMQRNLFWLNDEQWRQIGADASLENLQPICNALMRPAKLPTRNRAGLGNLNRTIGGVSA
jgi:hypothetical protein